MNREQNDKNTPGQGFVNRSESGEPDRPITSKYAGPALSARTSAITNLEETRIDRRTKQIDPPAGGGPGGFDPRKDIEPRH